MLHNQRKTAKDLFQDIAKKIHWFRTLPNEIPDRAIPDGVVVPHHGGQTGFQPAEVLPVHHPGISR